MATRNNTVPLGKSGTGAAFLLGGSKALDNWMAQDQRNAQVRSINAQNKREFQEGIAKSYNANRVKTPIGQAYQAQIMGDVEKLNEIGAKYSVQGFDIYNPNFRDPNQVAAHNQFMQDRAILETKIAARKLYEDTVKNQREAYDKDPYGYDDTPDDVYPSFEEQNSLDDIVNGKVRIPSLQKTFDYNKNVTEQMPVLKTQNERLEGNERVVEDVANVPAITAFANKLLTTGQARNWVEKQIGGSVDGLLHTTDKSEIKKALDSEFRSPTGIEMMAELAVKGKVPAFGTPQYDKFLDEAVREQLKAEEKYDKILSGAVQDGIAKANPSYKRVPDFSLASEARARRAEQRSIEASNRERVRFNERNDPKAQDEQVTFRQQWVDDMWNQEAGSGERLKSIVSGQDGYDGELGIRIQGNKINYIIPRKVESTVTIKDGQPSTTSKVIPGRTVTIDRSNANDKNKLNELINDLTGETINPTKFNTSGGKGKVQGNIKGDAPKYKTTISRGEIASRASAAGYSVSEYEKLLKQNGVKIQ